MSARICVYVSVLRTCCVLERNRMLLIRAAYGACSCSCRLGRTLSPQGPRHVVTRWSGGEQFVFSSPPPTSPEKANPRPVVRALPRATQRRVIFFRK